MKNTLKLKLLTVFFHFIRYISSCECKKVVSDILGEIEYLTDIDSTAEKAHFEP